MRRWKRKAARLGICMTLAGAGSCLSVILQPAGGDGKASLEEERKKAEEAFENRNKPKNVRTAGGSKKTGGKKKSSAKKETVGSAGETAGCTAEQETETEETGEKKGKVHRTASRGQVEGQVSLFNMGDVA